MKRCRSLPLLHKSKLFHSNDPPQTMLSNQYNAQAPSDKPTQQELNNELEKLRKEIEILKLDNSKLKANINNQDIIDENKLLHTKLKCYIDENNIWRGKVKSLQMIIEDNAQRTTELQKELNINKVHLKQINKERWDSLYSIDNSKNNELSKDGLKNILLELMGSLDTWERNLNNDE